MAKASANVVFSLATQVLVRDDQQGVHHLQQFRDASFSKAHAALALEVERLGDYTDGENAKLTRGPGDNGRCPGAGTAAHAGSNEHQVCACASVLATMKSTPCSPAAIMLLTALPPAPPTPNTIMRAFISRISVMLVIFASRLLRQEEDTDLLPTCLAVCFHYGRG